jgi:hypothetical protein
MPDADFTKWPMPEDIARVILFLCSDDAKLIHCASVPVYWVSVNRSEDRLSKLHFSRAGKPCLSQED